MISVILFLVAAVLFALVSVRAERKARFFMAGVCTGAAIVSTAALAYSVLMVLAASGWQP